MVGKDLKQKIQKLLITSSPIKARALATILSREFGPHVDRADVNSALFAMLKEGLVKRNDSFEWSLAKEHVQDDNDSPAPTAEPEIEFTAEQQAIISLDPANHLLIRGQAGSGKTTVLAARAGRILSALNQGSLLFLTYNSALSSYVKTAFTKSGLKGSIDVRTFHDWAKSTSESLGYEFNGWVDGKKRSEKVCEIIEDAQATLGQHRLYELKENSELLRWWSEEIAWLFGQYITRLDEYLTVERKGRGNSVRLPKEDRKFAWFVYEAYQEWLEENRKEDYDNPAGLILRCLMEKNVDLPENLRYDHVLVDEVQDFDKSWLLAVVKIPNVSLTLAGDLAQKIYKRNFTWTSVGINVRGSRSRYLSGSHRTTKQIMDVASYLLIDNSITTNDDYVAPISPRRNGEAVKIIVTHGARDAYEKGYDYIADSFKRLRTANVAVALPFSKQLYPAREALKTRRLDAEIARGARLGKLSPGTFITTYHQLKGLEFDHVVILGLHDAQYPGRLLSNIAEEDQPEEEQLMKRVLYVAMTRAKKTVTLVGSKPFCRFFNQVPGDLFTYLS
jgi:superfamily I DNA/RNA helicase